MKNEKMAESIFTDFEKRVEDKTKTSFALVAETIASDLVLNSPYVSDHFVSHGLFNKGEHTRFAPVFSANLYSQLFGAGEGRGHKLTTVTANKRAEAVTVHALRNFRTLTAKVKARRKTDNDLYLGIRDAALVESIQCDFIAGTPLSAQAEAAASISLMRRFSRELPKFRQFLVLLGVDTRDAAALRQVASEGKLREYLQYFYSDSLYFQRRQGIIIQKEALADTTDNAIALRRTKGAIFTEGAIAHAIDKLGLSHDAIFARLESRKAA